jgi:Flp pilus assembly protein TadG
VAEPNQPVSKGANTVNAYAKVRVVTKASHRRASGCRRGAAVVEAALCVPVAMLLLFGTVELTRAMHLRQTIAIAAYEGGRLVTLPGTTSDTVRTSVEQVLDDRGITECTVTLDPPDLTSAARGELVTVTVTAPAQESALLPLRYFTGSAGEVTSSVTVMKEF